MKELARAGAVGSSRISRWLPAVVGGLIVLTLSSEVGWTQSPEDIRALLREIEQLKQGQAAIQKDLAELKALLLRQPSAPPPAAPRPALIGAAVSVTGAPFKGREDAPLTMVEFSDYQCPFCSRHVVQTSPLLDKEYVETGKVKHVFRNLPIESIHPFAFKAAEAAECANDQNKFWPMHDRLFANQTRLAPDMLSGHAGAVGLDAAAFEQCLSSGRHAAKIRKDLGDAEAMGINGTPAFVIGRTVPGSATIKVEAFVSGARPYAFFKQEIDRLLGPP